jgi:hypothetical protein
MSDYLIGNTSSGTGSMPAPRCNLSKWTASYSGTLKIISIYGTGGGNCKIAIYADNSGSPGSLLAANNDDTPVTANAWTDISISDVNITADTVYWLGVANDTANGVTSSASTGGTRKYKTITYSGYTFPNPAGTGWSDGS